VSRFPDVERIDCVEIEPGVLEAAAYLERLHRGVLQDPRLHIYFDDARKFPATSRGKYEPDHFPSHRIRGSQGSLHSTPKNFLEWFMRTSKREEIFVQWIQAYGLRFDDLAMILFRFGAPISRALVMAQFGSRFSCSGSNDARASLVRTFARALENGSPAPGLEHFIFRARRVGPSYFRLGRSAIHSFASQAPSNTDDQTLLEYSAPEHLLRESLTKELERAVDALGENPCLTTFRLKMRNLRQSLPLRRLLQQTNLGEP